MAKTDFKTVADYLATLGLEEQIAVRAICDVIQQAVPEAEGTISYQLPAYKYHGWIFYVSAATKHYAISCPPPWNVFEAFKAELAPYNISKSTIQFPKSEPLPLDLIAAMSKYRGDENVRLEAAKAKKPKT